MHYFGRVDRPLLVLQDGNVPCMGCMACHSGCVDCNLCDMHSHNFYWMTSLMCLEIVMSLPPFSLTSGHIQPSTRFNCLVTNILCVFDDPTSLVDKNLSLHPFCHLQLGHTLFEGLSFDDSFIFGQDKSFNINQRLLDFIGALCPGLSRLCLILSSKSSSCQPLMCA